ncbi:hypothetical protein TNCV_2929411 [Trichonephila clavipes]|nr:hypothetical protein TNCV_2929411 [Trichonephila clavipes]
MLSPVRSVLMLAFSCKRAMMTLSHDWCGIREFEDPAGSRRAKERQPLDIAPVSVFNHITDSQIPQRKSTAASSAITGNSSA